MRTRRSLLRDGAGAIAGAGLAAAAGCLDSEGGNGDGDWLATLPDPTPAVVPGFHSAFTFEPATLRDQLGADPMPELAGQLVAIVGDVRGSAVEDVERLSGQRVRRTGHPGSDVGLVTPTGSDLVAEGDFAPAPTTDWLVARDYTPYGEHRGFRRVGTEGPPIEAFAVADDALLFGTRTATDHDANTVATDAVDEYEDDAAPVRDVSPPLAAVLEELPEGTAEVATAFALIAERPDAGTAAADEVAASLLAAGVAATVDGQTTDLIRVLHYRRDRRASIDAVDTAFAEAVAAGRLETGEWTVSAGTRSVRIERTVETAALADEPGLLRRAVPVEGYEDLTVPVDPRALGREAPPQVSLRPELLEDGRVAIEHAGGPELEALVVAYEADGERVTEPWSGPIAPEDRHETEQAPDPGSIVDVVWARGTVDETILLRSELGDG